MQWEAGISHRVAPRQQNISPHIGHSKIWIHFLQMANAMKVADAKLQTRTRQLSQPEGWLGCNLAQFSQVIFSSLCVALREQLFLRDEIQVNNFRFQKTTTSTLAVLMAIAMMSGCGGGKSNVTEKQAPIVAQAVAQKPTEASKLCPFANDDEAVKCQPGQIALFIPQSWGNEQLPIIYAAKYCDFNFPIVHTNGAVSCVFFNGRTVVKVGDSQTPSPQAPQSQ